MDIKILVKVAARAWSLEILAHLHRGVAGRQAPLLAATGAGRTAFGQSLSHLVTLGMLERNPGHGHPLRPEFRLTVAGTQMAKVADDVLAVVPEAETAVLRRHWTVPVLAAARHPQRFSDIKGALGTVSDRALSQTLDLLQDRVWIARDVDVRLRPLRPMYRATQTGLLISAQIAAA